MIKPLFTKWYVKYILLLICIAVLIVVPMLRPESLGLVGGESYFNLRLAEDLNVYDDLSFGGRFASYEWGTSLVLALAPNFLIQVLPLILGVLSFILFWKIIKKVYDDKKTERLTMLLLVLSPTFIYIFNFGNSLFIPTFLCVLAFFLFIQDKHSWLSFLIVFLLPFFNIVMLTSLILCLFFYTFFIDKKKKKLFISLLIVGLVVSLLYYGLLILVSGFPQQIAQDGGSWMYIFQKLIYDFGSEYGIGIFILILAILGMSYKWKEKYNHLFMFFGVLSFIVLSFFRVEALIFLNLFFCVLGAFGVQYLLERKKGEILTYGMIIILCGLVFSAISQLDSLTEAEPNKGMINAMEYLQTREEGVVLSSYENGIYINYAGHKNVIDENYLFVDDAEERFADVEEVFQYRELEEMEEVFEKYDIKYILIDEKMREELWDYESDGLLFILQYTRDFIKLYDKGGVEIWIWEEL